MEMGVQEDMIAAAESAQSVWNKFRGEVITGIVEVESLLIRHD